MPTGYLPVNGGSSSVSWHRVHVPSQVDAHKTGQHRHIVQSILRTFVGETVAELDKVGAKHPLNADRWTPAVPWGRTVQSVGSGQTKESPDPFDQERLPDGSCVTCSEETHPEN